MNIENTKTKNIMKISEIDLGEAFEYLGDIYIRASVNSDLKATAFDPAQGCLLYIPEDVKVLWLPNAKIVY